MTSGAKTAVYWCAGMFASGSTWAYNVMRAILAVTQPDRPAGGRFVNTLDDLHGLADHDTCTVVKSHDLAPEVAAALRPLARRIVVTIRDPRDAVTSLMLYQRYPFDLALQTVAASAQFVGDLAQDERSLLLRYESGFIDDPASLDRIAAWLGGTLPAAARERLFAQSRRGAIEGLIGALPTLPRAQRDARSGDIFDPETQWHAHHAGRSGEVGRWRRALLPGQTAAVERDMAAWMARFGYAPAPVFSPGYSLSIGSISFKSNG
jgi:hypothetical protein